MRFLVDHKTTYRYSLPISLGPHVLRLRPRSDPFQKLLKFDLKIDPTPAYLWSGADINGNAFESVVFDGLAKRLTIQSRLEIETLLENPFNFILDTEAMTLPMRYPADQETRLWPYLQQEGSGMDGVAQFARRIAEDVGSDSVSFVTALCRQIQQTFEYEIREDGNPLTGAETLRRGTGSCRDFATLMMDACRAVGIASRFVSGYQEVGPEPEGHRLHAWMEAYLPGAGWRGFDPSTGLAVSNRHVAVAAGAKSPDAAPIVGGYYGADRPTVDFKVELDIRETDGFARKPDSKALQAQSQ